MRFDVLRLALRLIALLRRCVEQVGRHDRSFASQIRRAASSVPLNIAEGNRRIGRDKTHHFRIAAGSADELRTALQVAEAWGYIDRKSSTETLELLDRVLAILWKLTH
jgi:four helix bundle protein